MKGALAALWAIDCAGTLAAFANLWQCESKRLSVGGCECAGGLILPGGTGRWNPALGER